MRIVGGRLGGRVLPAEPPSGVRPTADRVREALASALEARGAFREARVLDLFAGTGVLSFEALSRGASRAVLVEKNPKVRQALTENARALSVEDDVTVLPLDLFSDRARVVEAIAPHGPFDLVFADPPYAEFYKLGALLDAMAEASLFGEDALIALEGPASQPARATLRLAPVRVYRYGDTLVSLFEPTRR